ncbi:hypothetical protein ACFZBM_27760 [Streptomyces lavendulae]|uniref:hypothetical protein n=1 Tax=Streptomyces lavendulae TaxID=1914 RepID=UPI00142E0724|nr:hypothetical protein [Streptomyces lavendulae]
MTETGKTVAEVAEDLGNNETTPAGWVSRVRRTGTAPAGGGDALERLRRANARLRRDAKEQRAIRPMIRGMRCWRYLA